MRILEGDLVPLFRDCVSPPFSVAERDPVETRRLEQVALVLEELANTPPEVTGEQVIHLKQRVNSQDLVDFIIFDHERTIAAARPGVDLFGCAGHGGR